jgi:hypothetical protein
MSKQTNLLKMNKKTHVLKLDSTEQQAWLIQHLPNRVGAAWVDLPKMKDDWEWKGQRPLGPRHFAQNADKNQVWCICRAVEHGQKAATRWLIEFVGICLNKKDKPVRPARLDTDVSIQSFADDGSDLQVTLTSSEALTLARVWQGCSKSCVHSTFRTKHYSADPPELADAFLIIVKHLQEKLYGPRGGKRLSDIVRKQQ